jgi:hypothetical protein
LKFRIELFISLLSKALNGPKIISLNAEYRIYDQQLTYCVGIHIDDPYGINLESRMLDKILYVFGKSDMPL